MAEEDFSVHRTVGRHFKVSSRRFALSPFHECYATPDIVMGVYAGRFFALTNGDDPVEQYWALRRKCALYDTPERPIEISGPDAVPLLDRVMTRPSASLRTGVGHYVLACTPQGGLFTDGILFRLEEDRFWFVQPDGAARDWLLAHSSRLDVRITDPNSRVLQFQGPTSPQVIENATDGAVGPGFGYFHAGFFEIGGQRVFVSRTGWTGELGYEIYTLGELTDCPRLWNDLLAAGRPAGMQSCSLLSINARRIEAGILDNGSDIDQSMTPFEAGLGAFVDLDAHEFTGRAALLKADRGRRLMGLSCPDAAPARGNLVRDGNRRVGSVTTGAWSPFLECGVGYVRFDQAGHEAGQRLTLQRADGSVSPCQAADLPFYDPQKRIPRGHDREIPERRPAQPAKSATPNTGLNPG